MNGLQTARAVIIDENPKESHLLQQALGKMGVGAAIFTGEFEQLPEHPLAGVRIVFLDLQLTPQLESDKYLDQTVAVLRACVQFVPEATGIICWTKHQDDIAKLQLRLKEAKIFPAFLHLIANKDKLVSGSINSIKSIASEIECIINELPGRRLLFDWEQVVHHAASNTVNTLLESASQSCAANNRANFDREVLRRVGAVARASAAEAIQTPEQAASAAFVGLAPLLSDTIETSPISKSSQNNSLLTEVLALSKNRIDAKDRASLNTTLLAACTGDDRTPRPGNIYVPQTWDTPDKFLHLPTKQFWTELARDLFNIGGDSPKETARISGFISACQPCLLEITPACDHAAGKTDQHSRMLSGTLIRLPDSGAEEYSLPPASRMFAKEIEYVEINTKLLSGTYKLIVSARRIFVVDLKDLAKHQPVLRLRHPVVADIRAWFASHAARPGYVAVH